MVNLELPGEGRILDGSDGSLFALGYCRGAIESWKIDSIMMKKD